MPEKKDLSEKAIQIDLNFTLEEAIETTKAKEPSTILFQLYQDIHGHEIWERWSSVELDLDGIIAHVMDLDISKGITQEYYEQVDSIAYKHPINLAEKEVGLLWRYRISLTFLAYTYMALANLPKELSEEFDNREGRVLSQTMRKAETWFNDNPKSDKPINDPIIDKAVNRIYDRAKKLIEFYNQHNLCHIFKGIDKVLESERTLTIRNFFLHFAPDKKAVEFAKISGWPIPEK